MANTVFTEIIGAGESWCWRRLFENGWSIAGQPEDMTVGDVWATVDHGQRLSSRKFNVAMLGVPKRVHLSFSEDGLTALEVAAGLRNVDEEVLFGDGTYLGTSSASLGRAQGWCWTRLFAHNVFFAEYPPIVSVAALLCLASRHPLTVALLQLSDRAGGGLHFEVVTGGLAVHDILDELSERPGETWCGMEGDSGEPWGDNPAIRTEKGMADRISGFDGTASWTKLFAQPSRVELIGARPYHVEKAWLVAMLDRHVGTLSSIGCTLEPMGIPNTWRVGGGRTAVAVVVAEIKAMPDNSMFC